MKLKVLPNSPQSSCLSLPGAGITDLSHHTLVTFYIPERFCLNLPFPTPKTRLGPPFTVNGAGFLSHEWLLPLTQGLESSLSDYTRTNTGHSSLTTRPSYIMLWDPGPRASQDLGFACWVSEGCPECPQWLCRLCHIPSVTLEFMSTGTH